ncbi:mechanosensitive ion channel protein 6-like [Coffea eugenioides]|uniref:Mechanosensitive ion channel protein n=1 Tax=Coffea arabica TaxID=13443 RepID=A0ABM4VSD4_COFAR|nr:mechanosensitive ion channel protein 6-like [Coffea eugenioides]
MASPSSPTDDHRREVIVKIDGGPDHARDAGHGGTNNQVWREPSIEFWKDNDSASPGGLDYRHHPTNANDMDVVVQDPLSKLIGQFLNKQRAAGAELSLDVDLEVDELHRDQQDGRSSCTSINDNRRNPNPPNFPPLSGDYQTRNADHNDDYELKVSYQQAPAAMSNRSTPTHKVIDIAPDERRRQFSKEIESSSDDDDHDEELEEEENNEKVHPLQEFHRRSNTDANNSNDGHNGVDDVQVLRCTSIQRRTGVLGRMKTKSRLIDPSPERPERRSGMIGKPSGPIRVSGMLGRASGMLGKQPAPPDDEEDDPLFDEDLPEEYRKANLNALTLLQWISLFLIVSALACTLAIPKWKKMKLRGLQLWKWEVLVLVLICGRLVSGWGIRIVVLLIERNFLLRKRVLYFVYGIRKPVQNCIWLGLVLISWQCLFDKKVEGSNSFLRFVNKLMVCMLLATILWLVKTLMVKVLASSFHVSTFFDRIQESLFNQYVIEMLSGPPLIEIKAIQEEEDRTMDEVWKLQNAGATLPPDLRPPAFHSAKSGKLSGKLMGTAGLPPRPSRTLSVKISSPMAKHHDDPGITIDDLHRLNPKNISAWNMKRLMNMVRHGVLSTLDEQIMGSSHHDESATQIRSECEAKVAARKIFRNVAKPRAKFIYLEDMMHFLREEEALKIMNIVEGSPESEKISRASLRNWVVNAFRERKALALTLNDTKTAVNKLHQMVNVIVGIIIVIICLVILGIATSKLLLFVSSQIVVVAFIFGNTCKTIFEAIIFLFVMHPFDVGDRCEIDGVQMVVEEMNILNTVFLRFDNQKILYPNSTLATKPIHNYYRSPDMGDSVDFVVHIATPAEKIAIMKQRIISYVESKKEHWYSSPTVVLMDLEGLNRLKMSVWIRHRMNYQDMGTRWQRRALLIEEMINIFKELDIDYRLLPLDINVRTLPPVNSNRFPSTWPTSSS